jgi:hypothetical protein
MSQAGFELAILATKRPQTYALTARPLGSAAIMLGVGMSFKKPAVKIDHTFAWN